MKRALVAACAIAALLAVASSGDAETNGAAPIVVDVVGDAAVRVLVAEGNVSPCDSSSNRALLRGVVAPGQPITLQTTAQCVCVQQTFAPMTASDWSAPRFACRPVDCSIGRYGRVCVPAADPTIRVTFTSRRT